MKMRVTIFPLTMLSALFLAACLVSCSLKVTPEEAVRTAQLYTELQWMPEERHVRHGPDSYGIEVHTPDESLKNRGDHRGYWRPGRMASGMPYKWGGFDTPETFVAGLREGRKAGDIATAEKVKLDDDAVSSDSVGIDCSGFISRCWGLKRHVYTRNLPAICDPVSWDQLRTGDILLKRGHVLMFVAKQDGFIIGYEAGPYPTWRARQCAIRISFLKKDGYAPLRYRKMAEPNPEAAAPTYNIPKYPEQRWRMGPY